MEFAKKQPAFLYLDKNGFYYYSQGLSQVLSLAFLATSVKDMDVINAGSILTQIKGFVDQYKLVPSTITIILSPNLTFEKDFVDLAPDAQKEAVEKYLDTVPFDSVLSKQYPIQKGIKIVACNEDLYLQLKNSFEKNGFGIDSVVSYQMLGQDQAYIRNLTADNASQLLKRVDHLRQFTMLSGEKEKVQEVAQNTEERKEVIKPKKLNTRLIVMIGVFVVLFIILGIMLVTM